MVSNLLKHMIKMTGHRDRAMLDASIVAALQEPVGAARMRTLDIYLRDGELRMRPRVRLENGHIELQDEQELLETEGGPVARYPELAGCIAKQGTEARRLDADGMSTWWLPV